MDGPRLVALRGDESDLHAALHPVLRRAVARRVHLSDDLIEDACQHAWLQLIRHQPDRGPTLLAWLTTVAVREGYRLSAQQRRTGSLDAPATGPDVGDATLADVLPDRRMLDESLEARRALRALATLPDRQRRIVVLKVAGLSYQEIAAAEGASWTTVNRQLVKARRRLRLASEHAA